MPRCCVPECDSGTFREVKRTRAAGLRVKSFFMFPKNDNLLQKWKEIIFHNAEKIIDKLKICELHFHESDIIKYDETILKDGTVHRIQRQRYILRNGAIPSLLNICEVGSINKITIDAGNCQNTKKSLFQIHLDDSICAKKNELQEHPQKNHKTIDQYKNIIYNYHRELNNDIRNTKEVESYNNIKIEKSIYNKKNNNDKYEEYKQNYKFFQLKHDLLSKNLDISSSWAYAFQENSVTFIYVHPLKFIVQLLCIIDSSMNVKISTCDKRVNLDVNIKFSSNTDLTDYLLKLEKTKCCGGTGIENTYSKKCQGFISSNEEYKRSRGYQRCIFCREFRRIILKKENNPISIKIRIREQNKKIKALQYKYVQLQKILFEKQLTYTKLKEKN